MILGEKNPKTPLELAPLIVSQIKDLELIYDNRLKTRIHTKELIRSLRYKTYLLGRFVHDRSLRITLFRSFILPKLDYGSALFTNLNSATTKKLEQIQFRFLKLATGAQSYCEALSITNLYPLWLRRIAASIQLLKAMRSNP